MSSEQVLFHLIRLALGTETSVSVPDDVDWIEVIELSNRHGVYAIACDGFQYLYSADQHFKTELDTPGLKQEKYNWFATVLQCEMRNEMVSACCKELYESFVSHRIPCCILKGQGVAQLYPIPSHRTPGDIDLWAIGERARLLDVARDSGRKVDHVNVKHADVHVYSDIPVELHFTLGVTYDPIVNRRLKQWIKEEAEEQCRNYDTEKGYAYPTVSFNLVYLMFHIYHHLFDCGVGLRQVTDYCCALLHSDNDSRVKAFKTLEHLKMKRFCSGMMWVMHDVYGLDASLLLCDPDEEEGRFILAEFMRGAGFGRYDEDYLSTESDSMFEKGFSQFRRNCRLLSHYPHEVLWSPVWKTWHWFWRWTHGYLKS